MTDARVWFTAKIADAVCCRWSFCVLSALTSSSLKRVNEAKFVHSPYLPLWMTSLSDQEFYVDISSIFKTTSIDAKKARSPLELVFWATELQLVSLHKAREWASVRARAWARTSCDLLRNDEQFYSLVDYPTCWPQSKEFIKRSELLKIRKIFARKNFTPLQPLLHSSVALRWSSVSLLTIMSCPSEVIVLLSRGRHHYEHAL